MNIYSDELFLTVILYQFDRSAAFTTSESKQYVHEKGESTSRTTTYNPTDNSKVEWLSLTLWETIMLTLKTKDLETNDRELVLLDALHSVRYFVHR
jgi:hypothetical protein